MTSFPKEVDKEAHKLPSPPPPLCPPIPNTSHILLKSSVIFYSLADNRQILPVLRPLVQTMMLKVDSHAHNWRKYFPQCTALI